MIDLHVHSTKSDGTMTPVELIRYAKQKGIEAISLTDHDTTDGVEEALNEAQKVGIKFLPGIEISVEFKPEMHILGYFTIENYKNINPVLTQLKDARDNRNPQIIKKLNEMGIDITIKDVIAEADGNIITRPHIARALLTKGYVKSMSEAFHKYIGDNKPAYYKKSRLSPEEGIGAIIKAGGIPVLAHPALLPIHYKKLDQILIELVSFGLKGLEAYYVENSDDDTGKLLRLALKHDIIATGGSDFHGSNKQNIDLGVGKGNLKVPYEAYEKIVKELEK